MTLPTRLLDLAARREHAMSNMGPSEDRDLLAQDVADLREAAGALEWRPTSEAPTGPGTYINVRTTSGYRWLAYSLHKKEGTDLSGREFARDALRHAVMLGYRLVPPPRHRKKVTP